MTSYKILLSKGHNHLKYYPFKTNFEGHEVMEGKGSKKIHALHCLLGNNLLESNVCKFKSAVKKRNK